MNTNHIDQLAEWWREAEKPAYVDPGDLMIQRHEPNDYSVTPSKVRFKPADDSIRILARAPKPAWHDAVAVMARCSNAPEGHREVFIKSDATPGVWIGEGGYGRTEDLRNVTPLIEAKVTDEMVHRAAVAFTRARDDGHVKPFTAALTAALGLETK